MFSEILAKIWARDVAMTSKVIFAVITRKFTWKKCRQNHDNSVNEIYIDKGTHELSFDGSTNFSQQKLGKLYSVSYGSLKMLIFDDVIMKSDDVITKIKKIYV